MSAMRTAFRSHYKRAIRSGNYLLHSTNRRMLFAEVSRLVCALISDFYTEAAVGRLLTSLIVAHQTSGDQLGQQNARGILHHFSRTGVGGRLRSRIAELKVPPASLITWAGTGVFLVHRKLVRTRPSSGWKSLVVETRHPSSATPARIRLRHPG